MTEKRTYKKRTTTKPKATKPKTETKTATKKTETATIAEPTKAEIDSELNDLETVVSEPVKPAVMPEPVKDKAYFKARLFELAEEMRIAIKNDRSLSIRLKSIYNNVNRDASRL